VVLAFEWKRTDSVFKDVDTSLELNCLTGREITYSVFFHVPLLVPKIMIRSVLYPDHIRKRSSQRKKDRRTSWLLYKPLLIQPWLAWFAISGLSARTKTPESKQPESKTIGLG
jgi:hypothetical protein